MEEERTELPFPTIVLRISQNSRQKLDAVLKAYELSFEELQAQWIEIGSACLIFKVSENFHRLVIPLSGFHVSLNLHLHWDSLTFSYHLKEGSDHESIILLPGEMTDHCDEAGWQTMCLLRFIEEQEAYFPQPDLLALYKKVELLAVKKENHSGKAQQVALWSSFIEAEHKCVEQLQAPIGVNYFHPMKVVSLPDEAGQKCYHLTINLRERETESLVRMEKQIGVVLSRSDFGKPVFDRWENRFFLKGMRTLSKEVLRDVESICLKHHYSFEPEPVHIIEGRVDLQPDPALQPIYEEVSAQLEEESGISVDFDAWGDAQISLEALPAFDKFIEERYDQCVKRNPSLGCIIKIDPYQKIHELEEELKQLCPSIELGISSNEAKLYVSHAKYNIERVKNKVEGWGFRFKGEAKKISVLNDKATSVGQEQVLKQFKLSPQSEDIKRKGELTGIILPDLQSSTYGKYPFYYKKVEADQEFGEVYLKNFENFLNSLYGEQNLEVTNELLFEQDDPLFTPKAAFETADWLEIRQACQSLGVKVYEEQNALYFEFKTTQELEEKIESLKRMKLFVLNYKPLYYKYKVRTECTLYNLDIRKQILEKIAEELSVFPGDLTLKYTNEECTMAYLKYAYSSQAELTNFMETVKEINEQSESFDISIKDEEGVTNYYFSKIDQGQLGFDQQIKAIKSQELFIMPQDYSALLKQLKKRPDNMDEAFIKRRIRGLSRKKLSIGQVLYYNITLKQITLRLNENQKNNFRKALTGGSLQYDVDYIFPRLRSIAAKIKRLKIALKEIAQLPAKDRGFINPNLSNFIFDSSAAKPIASESLKLGSEAYELLEKYQQEQLNALQKSAVLKSVVAEDLALIQGPPGTGKTTVLAEIAWQLIARNRQAGYKLLITSETNLAVDNAFEKLENRPHTIVKPVRFGDTEKFEGEGKKYSLARMKRWSEGYDDHLIPEPESGNGHRYINNNAVRDWMFRIAEKSEHSVDENEDLCDILEEWQKDLREPVVKDRKVFYEKYLKHVNVVGSTCASVGSRSFNTDFNTLFGTEEESGGQKGTKNYLSFDSVIVDEAGKLMPAELLLPLKIAKKSILIGDKKQLPSRFLTKFFSSLFHEMQEKDKIGLKQNASFLQDSQFKQMIDNPDISDTLVCQLETQYRMHEDILAVTQPLCYDPSGLKSGIISHQDKPYTLNHFASRHHGIYNTLKKETGADQYFLTPDTHVLWIDVDTPEVKEGMSRINRGEVEAVKRVLEYLRYADGFDAYQKYWKESGMMDEIGLISFYKSQIDLLEEAKEYASQLGIKTRLKAVNKFQGMERNIVIISTVRSDKMISSSGRVRSNKRNLEHPAYSPWGFAESSEWLNVALSRAKSLLIVVGNKKHFENYKNPQGEAIYRNAIRVIEQKGKVIHYKELVKYES